MHWWPMQTPKSGKRGPSVATASSEMPDSSGAPGPGDTSTPAGFIAAMSATEQASLATTT